MSLNKVMLIGNVGKDPEVRYLENNPAPQGSQLYIEGRIRTRSWNDQAGAKQYRTEIVADSIQLLGRKSDNPASQQPSDNHQTGYQPQGGYQSQGGADMPAGFAPRQASQPAAPQAQPDYSSPSDDLPF